MFYLNPSTTPTTPTIHTPNTKVWTRLEDATLRVARNGFGTVAYGDQLFVLGGDDGSMRVTSSECLDIRSVGTKNRSSRCKRSGGSSSSSSNNSSSSSSSSSSASDSRTSLGDGPRGSSSIFSDGGSSNVTRRQLPQLEWELVENQLAQARNGAAYIVHPAHQVLIAVGGMTRPYV